ncbi:MAG: CCA tRNA nucleotidyltransferase [Oscillospiraceae bacterium]|nr:CCA tRNA nucleotidyltransferase [Oscillospiraceae bacterium]
MENNFCIPGAARRIIDKIEENGFEAYFVGGCVRDKMLGREPNDYDIASDAEPEDIIDIFGDKSTVKTGIKHGTVTVLDGKIPFEITTYRTESGYTDNRRPDKVSFVKDIKEDLSRRDFTVNAAAYSPVRGLADPFGAAEDINARLIRTVGEAEIRFREDALRIMRAVRFSAQLGFSIESKTERAVMDMYSLLDNISAERKSAELMKTLAGKNAAEVLRKYDELFMYLLPCLKKNKAGFYENISKIEELHANTGTNNDTDEITFAAALFMNTGESFAEDISRMRFSNNVRAGITELVRYSDKRSASDTAWVRRAVSETGEPQTRRLLKLRYSGGEYARMNNIFEDIKASGKCTSLKDMAVGGDDIVKLCGTEGKHIGAILRGLFDLMIDNDIENDRAILLNIAEKMIKEGETHGD